MFEVLKASQTPVSGRLLNKLADFAGYSGHEVTHLYQGLGLFKTADLNVAAVIGASVIADLGSKKIPLRPIARAVGEMIYGGVIYLALNIDNWQFELPPEDSKKGRDWIGGCSEHLRRRHIEELLGMQERKSGRFLIVNRDQTASTINDISALVGASTDRIVTLLDVYKYADELLACRPGALFSLKLKALS